ncbi:unnamed protein product [Heligmosomoides polygyrus]|uniref:Reverse transcriptase domain-containing protein n=1 Tax=Heligmosomoides polygyrus TaxID=6339 RepID=A0A183G8Z7_HELPZ|nr:unnamed protein product [Heligmosomoides polygyrus]
MYNHTAPGGPQAAPPSVLIAKQVTVASETTPTRDEVTEAIKLLRNSKAAGIDGVTAEALKAGEESAGVREALDLLAWQNFVRDSQHSMTPTATLLATRTPSNLTPANGTAGLVEGCQKRGTKAKAAAWAASPALRLQAELNGSMASPVGSTSPCRLSHHWDRVLPRSPHIYLTDTVTSEMDQHKEKTLSMKMSLCRHLTS